MQGGIRESADRRQLPHHGQEWAAQDLRGKKYVCGAGVEPGAAEIVFTGANTGFIWADLQIRRSEQI